MKTIRHIFILVLALLMVIGLSTGIGMAQEAQQAQFDRTVLPITPPYTPPRHDPICPECKETNAFPGEGST